MSALLEKQFQFSVAQAELILHARSIGYQITIGDAYRDSRVFGELGTARGYGHAKSCHKLRLAIDLNLFKDGQLVTDPIGHHLLHNRWDELGGSPRIAHDMNHYSFKWEGMR